jgi:phosphate transport system substrate-binding protein
MKGIVKYCLAMAVLTSCADKDKNGNVLDTPTAGTITITADEALKPLIDAEIKAFEGIYHKANIDVRYMSEGEALDELLRDSARLTIITRRLVESEQKILLDQTIVPKQLTLARDGIALISNRQFTDSLMTLDELTKVLTGGIDQVNQHVKTQSSAISQVVFDQRNSGIIRFLRDSLTAFDILPDYCFAVNNNAAVVEHIAQNPNALGLIDVSWISDRDDSTANSFLNSIRVLGVSADSGFYQPYQAYLAQGKYPLLRDVVMISREARSGLASGFMAFVASDKGQRIVLKSGLVPATMPIRIIEVNHEPF